MPEKTIFQKIMDGEIPAEFLYEDELCIAIKDINPKAPVHFLVIPRKLVTKVQELGEEDKGLTSHLIYVAKKLAEDMNCENYRLQINNGEKAGQTVFHLHLHLLGWPNNG